MSAGLDAQRVLEELLAGRNLSETGARELLNALTDATLEPAQAGALLIALRQKGETAAEIRGFALAMRELARRPALPRNRDYVDIVGTGGDSSGSLNLSTGSALLAAACGLAVVKHGNRSISSHSGSADVLAALGLRVPLDEPTSARCLDTLGFTFLFAPHYHPAMKHIAPVRKALGVRTVFNILGPLVNPAEPAYHVIGAFSEPVAELMAATLAGMPIKRAFVVHGAMGWDEATPVGPFVCFDVHPGDVQRSVWNPADHGIAACTAEDLRGSDPATNSARLCAALRGEDTLAHREALALGAALALIVTGRQARLADAIAAARAAIADGSAARLLEGLTELGGAQAP